MAVAVQKRRLSCRGTWEGGCSMDRQKWLPFEYYEQLDMLWAQFPESERLKVVRLYGRRLRLSEPGRLILNSLMAEVADRARHLALAALEVRWP